MHPYTFNISSSSYNSLSSTFAFYCLLFFSYFTTFDAGPRDMLSRLSIAYSTISFLSVFLSLILLPRHIQARDAGLLLVLFLSIVNFLYGLNTVAFTGVTLLTCPIYCDIGMSRINQTTFITTSFNTNPTFKSNEHNANSCEVTHRSANPLSVHFIMLCPNLS